MQSFRKSNYVFTINFMNPEPTWNFILLSANHINISHDTAAILEGTGEFVVHYRGEIELKVRVVVLHVAYVNYYVARL